MAEQSQRVLKALAGFNQKLRENEQNSLVIQVDRFADRTAGMQKELGAAQRVTSEDLAIRVNVMQKRR